jgi:hypothetical protein
MMRDRKCSMRRAAKRGLCEWDDEGWKVLYEKSSKERAL